MRKHSALKLVILLFVGAVIAAPLIFYGLLALGSSGWLDGILNSPLALAMALLVAIAAVWIPILWLGARMDREHLERERAEREFSGSSNNG